MRNTITDGIILIRMDQNIYIVDLKHDNTPTNIMHGTDINEQYNTDNY